MSGRRQRPTSSRTAAPTSTGLAVVCVVLVTVLLTVDTALGRGRFDVRSAGSRLADGVYVVTARLDYRLSDEALEALDSGLTLTIQLQIELVRQRRFRPDSLIATLKQDYQLSYQPLSERYLVRNLNSGEQKSHATLFSALNDMGRIVELPVIDAALLDPEGRYWIRLRAVLDQNTLPGPLRLLAFWSEGFRLESDWYRWTLRE